MAQDVKASCAFFNKNLKNSALQKNRSFCSTSTIDKPKKLKLSLRLRLSLRLTLSLKSLDRYMSAIIVNLHSIQDTLLHLLP